MNNWTDPTGLCVGVLAGADTVACAYAGYALFTAGVGLLLQVPVVQDGLYNALTNLALLASNVANGIGQGLSNVVNGLGNAGADWWSVDSTVISPPENYYESLSINVGGTYQTTIPTISLGGATLDAPVADFPDTLDDLWELCNSGLCGSDQQYLLDTLTAMAGIISAFAKGKAIPISRVIPRDTGDCTDHQYDGLNAEVDRLCKRGLPTACGEKQLNKLRQKLRSSQGMKKAKDVIIPKELIEERFNNNLACEQARQKVQDTCFSTNPDKDHIDEIAKLVKSRQVCQDELNNM